MPCRDRLPNDLELSYGDRELESTGTSAPWIDVENPVPSLAHGTMRVPEDDDAETGRDGVEIKFREIVQNVDQHIVDLKYVRLRDRSGPGPLVVVPAHDCYRGQVRKLVEHLDITNVTRVDNEITAPKKCHRLGSQQAVGVGNEPNTCHAVLMRKPSPGAH